MTERYGAIPERAALDRRLTGSHYRVLIALAARANKIGEWSWTTSNVLVERTKIETRSLRRFVGDLVTWGYVSRRPAKNGAPRNEYRILLGVPKGEGYGHPGGGGVRAPLQEDSLEESSIMTKAQIGALASPAPTGGDAESDLWRVTELVQSLEPSKAPRPMGLPPRRKGGRP